MPALKIARLDDVAERREIAQRLAQARVIRLGADAWAEIAKCQSFDAWRKIGAALSVGKQYALRVSGASEPWGRNYTHAFSHWARIHGFNSMAASVRSVAIELHENIQAIETWRATLPEQQRRRLIHPLSNVRRWRAATTYNGKSPTDYKRDALFHWRRFLGCVQALPTAEQAAMWSMVSQARIADVAAA